MEQRTAQVRPSALCESRKSTSKCSKKERKVRTMTNPSYFDRYENLAFSRDDNGVLTMRFHTNGGPIVFTGQTHEDLPLALEEVALDDDNRAMIITGTGDTFMDQIDG